MYIFKIQKPFRGVGMKSLKSISVFQIYLLALVVMSAGKVEEMAFKLFQNEMRDR